MHTMQKIIFVMLLFASGFQIKAGTDENQWLFPIDLQSGEGLIELSDTAYPSGIYFLLFGNHSFEPDSVFIEKKGSGSLGKNRG